VVGEVRRARLRRRRLPALRAWAEATLAPALCRWGGPGPLRLWHGLARLRARTRGDQLAQRAPPVRQCGESI